MVKILIVNWLSIIIYWFSSVFVFSFVDDTLLKALAISLNDFSSFDQMSPIAYLLEVLPTLRFDFCNGAVFSRVS